MNSRAFGQPNGQHRLSMKERFDRANRDVDIVGLAQSVGMDIRLQAGLHFARCIFHEDTGRANMCFYPDPGERFSYPRAYCFTCKTVATAIDLIKAHQGTDATGALQIIESYMGVSPLQAAVSIRSPAPPKPAVPQKNLRPAVDLCRERLWSAEGEHARDYLERRGLLEIASEYQFGLWWPDASHWSGRLVIPYLTDSPSTAPGAPVFSLVGRQLGNDRSGVLSTSNLGQGIGRPELSQHDRTNPKYLYTKGQGREPYNWGVVHRGFPDTLEQGVPLVITEGELDCASVLYASGGSYPVIGLGGAGQVGTIRDELAGCTVLYIRDRGEESTDSSHEKAVSQLRGANATVHVITPHEINPGGKTDMNDMLVSFGVEGLASWLADTIAEVLYADERELV